jgi:hypothetical protein
LIQQDRCEFPPVFEGVCVISMDQIFKRVLWCHRPGGSGGRECVRVGQRFHVQKWHWWNLHSIWNIKADLPPLKFFLIESFGRDKLLALWIFNIPPPRLVQQLYSLTVWCSSLTVW